ncbi:TPA: J domain-containing protein [Candidatus Woesearchaeota archaeon]|nr:J domain-containing protein [Candidatus Woesearchaeota archaeon]
MVTITVKGHELTAFTVKDSFNRRATLFRNNIIESLHKIGLNDDHVDVPMEPFAMKKAPASAVWFLQGRRFYYSYNMFNKFVENLYVVSKIIELEVNALLEGKKTMEQFIADFTEDRDVEEQRKEAREILGVSEDTKDMNVINKQYKILAKEFHPDMPQGNPEKFKAINNAHKTLKRELE